MTIRRHTTNFVTLVGLILLGFVVGLAVLQIGTGYRPAGIVLVSHDYDDRCQGYECREGGSGNEGEYRDDNRRAGISPGPFDRSPVDFRDNRITLCFPFANCRQADEDQPPPERQR